MDLYNHIMNKFLYNYYVALHLQEKIELQTDSIGNFDNYKLYKNKIGYIVATCSPVTKAHLELAQRAIKKLNLDYLFFIIWPFYYIEGFHSSHLNEWIKKEKHINWENRIKLLELALNDLGNQKIKILYEVKKWYIESENMFNQNDKLSYFWTGTWYVIRKLQAFVNSISSNNIYYFVSGSDQYNPNIYSLIDTGKEKV